MRSESEIRKTIAELEAMRASLVHGREMLEEWKESPGLENAQQRFNLRIENIERTIGVLRWVLKEGVFNINDY